MIEWSISKRGACRSYAEVPKGAEIVRVNGKEVIGTCEVCARPIFWDQHYARDTEGIMWHAVDGRSTCPSR